MAKRKSSASPKKSRSSKLEESLARLEEIARRLEEDEDLPLDESLRLFEEGVSLSRDCGRRLAEAEQKVEILARQAQGGLEPEPFAAEGDGE